MDIEQHYQFLFDCFWVLNRIKLTRERMISFPDFYLNINEPNFDLLKVVEEFNHSIENVKNNRFYIQ